MEAYESVKLVGTDRARNVCPKVHMNIQELLDKEASLGNRRYHVIQQIKAQRGVEPPRCWGMDDCSTQIMSTCPWRIDCGDYEATHWQEKQPW